MAKAKRKPLTEEEKPEIEEKAFQEYIPDEQVEANVEPEPVIDKMDDEKTPAMGIPETKPEAKPATPPAQSVGLRVFATVSGLKLDQLAGFVYYAQKNNLGPMSMSDWKVEHDKFLSRPV